MNINDYLKGKISLGKKRSGRWPALRKSHLIKNPECAVCGSKKKVEVHHIVPFHIDPSLELDENNLITLCESNKAVNCHLFCGHLGNYQSYNSEVCRDSSEWYDKIKNRPVKLKR